MPFITARLLQGLKGREYEQYNADARKMGITGVCGRGWVGTKGNCRRAKSKGKLTEKQKAGARELALKIRAERGLGAGAVKSKKKPYEHKTFEEEYREKTLSKSNQARLAKGMKPREEVNAARAAQGKPSMKRSETSAQREMRHMKSRNQREADENRVFKGMKPRSEVNAARAARQSSPQASGGAIARSSSGAMATRKERANTLAKQAGKYLGDRAKADIEITRKAIAANAPAVKKAAMEGAKKLAYNAGAGFGKAVNAAKAAKKKRS